MTYQPYLSRHRVIAAGAEGMAAEYPFGPQPSPFKKAVFADCLIGVLGTAGYKPASRWHYLREAYLIKPDKP